MINLKETFTYIKSADTILDDMIVKAKTQNAINFDMLLALKDGLNELSEQLLKQQSISDSFTAKWDMIMGWVPKVFEDHPLLEILRKVDDFIMKENS